MSDFDTAVRAALGASEGFLLPWRIAGGCQLISSRYRSLLPCPYREAKWQCEVIGPHTRHDWSIHLIRHEQSGNGWRCGAIDAGIASGKYTRITIRV